MRLRQRLRAPARSVRAGCCPHRGARVPAGGAGREGTDLPLEGGPEVHRTCGLELGQVPAGGAGGPSVRGGAAAVRCPAALSSSSPRSQDEAKVVALRSNAVWGPRAPPLRPRGPAQAGSTAPDPASFNAPRLSPAASGRAGGSQRWLRRRSGRVRRGGSAPGASRRPRGRPCRRSPVGDVAPPRQREKFGGAGAERPHRPGAERQIPASLLSGGSRDRAGAQPLNVTAPGISAL